jgi:hypothetical protein
MIVCSGTGNGGLCRWGKEDWVEGGGMEAKNALYVEGVEATPPTLSWFPSPLVNRVRM